MSPVQEIQAALARLSCAELEQIRAWIGDYLEDQLDLNSETVAVLHQSRNEIAEGKYTCRIP